MIAKFEPASEHRLLDPKQARSFAGVLAVLTALAGPKTSLGIILQQARSEILSLLHSQEEEERQGSERRAA
jgi:hypothetical protein